ncbi:HNH endonuclease signature motif containing protein [Psychroserpens luteus]|uniref:HNH endonuclease n=1 Tax=Psychroserpens luteus TaxID=1434066 RepID=A0ABW6A174_9FLAO|nr:HNH endonuclease signature motif containing protein [Psychroserpens luteus]
MDKKLQNLIKYGLGQKMASYFIEKGLSVTSIKGNSKKNLIEKFGLTKIEADEAKNKISRQPIDKKVVNDLLLHNNFTCCCCLGNKGKSYVIHHIEEYEISQNNNIENLALICPVCHDLAHSKRALTLTISKEQLLKAKRTWEESCINKRGIKETYPLDQTWEAEFDYFDDNFILKYSMDLSVWQEKGKTKGYFNVIYLDRGNICLAGEFEHQTVEMDVDVNINYWFMNWNMRVSKKMTERIILNYGFGDQIIWICKNGVADIIPYKLEFRLIKQS